MRFVLMVTFIMTALSASAFSSDLVKWDDLEVGGKYRLLSDISFPEGYTLQKDRGLILNEISGAIGVIYFKFKNIACTDNKIKAESVIIDSVGVELLENCMVGMWVDAHDYYDEGLLAR